MAYVDNRSNTNRTPIVAAIGLIHAGVIYALVTGLAGVINPADPAPPIYGEQIPLPPIPKPDPRIEPEPTAEPLPRQTSSAAAEFTPTFTLPEQGFRVEVNDALPELVLPRLPAEPLPTPSSEPLVKPKQAAPMGKPGLWVTPNDYPAADLRAEHEGITRFRLTIGADGTVQSCEITASSGYASLDAAACASVRKRARFAAATDASGAAVPGTYASAVRWQIPKN